jgi:hypothetical protein
VLNVWVKVFPGWPALGMFPESNCSGQDAATLHVTVCEEPVSASVQRIVLLIPITTLTVAGAKPGAPEGVPDPSD